MGHYAPLTTMLVIEKHLPLAKVQVRSVFKPEDFEVTKNILIFDYEDYVMLKRYHFYKHVNGSTITRRQNRQINVNRIIANIHGYFDLQQFPKIVVKFEDGDKSNFSKDNLVYHFTSECVPSQRVQTIPRGVYHVDDLGTSKYQVRIANYDSDLIIPYPTLFDTEVEATIYYRQLLRETKGDWKEWV